MPGRSRPPLFAYDAERIALLKPSALGDIVHSLPVLTALRQRYPHAHITWVVNQAYEPLLHGHRDLDDTLPFDRRRLAPRLARGGAIVAGLCEGAATPAFRSGHRLARTVSHGGDGGGDRSETACRPEYGPRRGDMVLHRCHSGGRLQRPARGRSLLACGRAFGVGDVPRQFHVPIPDEARRWADEKTHGCPRPWLMLGPGSRWPTKRWPPEHFAALASRVAGRFRRHRLLRRRRRRDAAGRSRADAAERPITRPDRKNHAAATGGAAWSART